MDRLSKRSRRARIVIVGGNFAGIAAAKRLGREHDVVVIDRSPWFEWLPNIHELVSARKTPEALRLSRRQLVNAAGHRFLRATVSAVDAEHGLVTTERGRKLPFDACIVAVGGVNDTFGVRGADRHAMPFKSIADCTAIAARLEAVARGERPRDVVVVGAGLEGIEALGEILTRYGEDRLRLTLVEAGDRLLPGTPVALGRHVRARLDAAGVRVLTGAWVEKVTARRVMLASGEVLRSAATIWTGGARPPRLLAAAGLSAGDREWAAVRPTLQSEAFDNLFVCGDAAQLAPPLAKQAYFALQMGEHAGAAVDAFLRGKTVPEFVPSPKPSLISFGHMETYLVLEGIAIASPLLGFAKEGVFQLTMAQLDPPFAAAPAETTLTRAWSAARELLLPVFCNPRSWPSLPRVTVLTDR